MRTLQRAGAGLLALTLATGIAACGSDDDKEATADTSAAGGDNAAFCDALIDFNTAAFQVDISDDTSADDIKAAGEELGPLSEALEENAPEDLKASAAEINDFVQPLREGDAGPFNQDSTFETYMGFLGEATSACDFEEVSVTAKDYAFEAPDTVKAGNVSFAFTNASEGEDHEMAVMQKADGVDLSWEELLALPEEEAMSKTSFVTAAYSPPGEGGSTLATLKPGKYVMVCFIPVGGAEDGPPHFTQGMIHEFTVE